jgi:hypothetical protein
MADAGVAVIGESMNCYNNYKYGFNSLSWSTMGDRSISIAAVGLDEAVQAQLDLITAGYDVGPTFKRADCR